MRKRKQTSVSDVLVDSDVRVWRGCESRNALRTELRESVNITSKESVVRARCDVT